PEKAKGYCLRAIEADPEFAVAWSGLALTEVPNGRPHPHGRRGVEESACEAPSPGDRIPPPLHRPLRAEGGSTHATMGRWARARPSRRPLPCAHRTVVLSSSSSSPRHSPV